MAKMVLLNQIDPMRLKLEPENKDKCHTHACEHCTKHFKKVLRALTMRYLKIIINSEQNTFIKNQKEAHDQHAKAMFNQFVNLSMMVVLQ